MAPHATILMYEKLEGSSAGEVRSSEAWVEDAHGPRKPLKSLGSTSKGSGMAEGDTPPPPTDPVIYLISVLLGLCLLTPWNVVINSYEYFIQLYPSTDPTAVNLPFYMTSATTFPSLPILFLMVWVGHEVSTKTRIVVMCLVQAGLMVLLPFLSPFSPKIPILLACLSGMCTCVLQSSVMGLVSFFPPNYSQGFMLGQGLSGITASFGQAIVQAFQVVGFTGDSPTYVYFGISAMILMGGSAGTMYLYNHPLAQTYILNSGGEGGEEGASGALEMGEKQQGGLREEGFGGSSSCTSPRVGGAVTETESLLSSQGSSGGDGNSNSGSGSGGGAAVSKGLPASLAVLRKSWKDLLAVFLVFFVTFLMFPGVMVYYEDYKGGFGPGADYLYPWVFGGKWYVIILIALFNVCDTIGRTLPGYSKYIPHIPQKWLLTAILCRALAIPIFVGCAWRWSPSLGDITLTLTTVAFAFSNGYLASSALSSFFRSF